MGNVYVQHAPYARMDSVASRRLLKGFKEAFPNHRYEVKKVLADGDFVMLHLHGMNGPNPHGESVIDIFRIKDGKVVEHWDVIQPIPANADNPNTMF
jgi:predicted SnoaL-like aldol condensation-catalyzing enzyme